MDNEHRSDEIQRAIEHIDIENPGTFLEIILFVILVNSKCRTRTKHKPLLITPSSV